MKLITCNIVIFLFFYIFKRIHGGQEIKQTVENQNKLLIKEIATFSRIAAKFVSNAHITEITTNPGPKANPWMIKWYKSAMERRNYWNIITENTINPILNYNVKLLKYVNVEPPPIQAFMNSENPFESFNQCLNAFNFLYVQNGYLEIIPKVSNSIAEILFKLICLNSVNIIFGDNWASSIFYFKDVIVRGINLFNKGELSKEQLTQLIEDFKSKGYENLMYLPTPSEAIEYINDHTEVSNMWNYLVHKSQVMFANNFSIKTPKRGEWVYIVLNGNSVPKCFVDMRKLRLMYTDSVQLTTSLLYSLLILKLRDPIKMPEFEVNVLDDSKKQISYVQVNVLLLFAGKLAEDYVRNKSEWTDFLSALLEVSKNEIDSRGKPTIFWIKNPIMPLEFNGEKSIPREFIINCIRSIEELKRIEIISINIDENEKNNTNSGLIYRKKIEHICTQVQRLLLPYVNIHVDHREGNQPKKSILKRTPRVKDIGNDKSIMFEPLVETKTYSKNSPPTKIDKSQFVPIGVTLKTDAFMDESNPTAKPEIPLFESPISETETDSEYTLTYPDLNSNTPYPFDEVGREKNIQELELNSNGNVVQ